MLKNYLQDDSRILTLDGNQMFNFQPFNLYGDPETLEQAYKISEETGIPVKFIYDPPFHHLQNWFKKGATWYYFKSDDLIYVLNELVGEKISEYFALETAHYQLARINFNMFNKYGITSANFCSPSNEYKRITDLNFSHSDEFDWLDNIKVLCKNNDEYKRLLLDLKKLFIRDFMSRERDRNISNFLFKINANGVRLAPLFDYEGSFFGDVDYYFNPLGMLDTNNMNTCDLLKHDQDFRVLLERLLNFNIEKSLENIEEENNFHIPIEFKEYYKQQIFKTKELVLKKIF